MKEFQTVYGDAQCKLECNTDESIECNVSAEVYEVWEFNELNKSNDGMIVLFINRLK